MHRFFEPYHYVVRLPTTSWKLLVHFRRDPKRCRFPSYHDVMYFWLLRVCVVLSLLFFFLHPTQAAQPLELSNSSVPKVFEKQCITSNWKLSLRSNRAWRLWPGTTSQSLQARKKREARSDSTACLKCKQIVQPSSELLCIYDRSDRYFLSRRRLISSFSNFSCSNSVLTLVFCEILNYIASVAAAKFRYDILGVVLPSSRWEIPNYGLWPQLPPLNRNNGELTLLHHANLWSRVSHHPSLSHFSFAESKFQCEAQQHCNKLQLQRSITSKQ